MTKFTVREEFPIGAAELVQLLNDPEYIAWMVGRHQRSTREILSSEDRDGAIHRSIKVTMRVDLPGPVARALNATNGVSWIEHSVEQRTDGATQWWCDSLVAAEKIDARGTLGVESLGTSRSRRIMTGDIKVSIFGVGGAIEKMISEGIQKGFASANRDLHVWLAQQKESK